METICVEGSLINSNTIKYHPHAITKLGDYQILTTRAEWSRVIVIRIEEKRVLIFWKSWEPNKHGRLELQSHTQYIRKEDIISVKKFKD